MRIRVSFGYSQGIFLLILLVSFFSGCSRQTEELPVLPQATNPLSRDFIGYGVVTDSFTNLLAEPGPGNVSQGYLRRGTVIRIIERRSTLNRGSLEAWVLAEGDSSEPGRYFGWLQESSVDIYENEPQAKTASEAMNL